MTELTKRQKTTAIENLQRLAEQPTRPLTVQVQAWHIGSATVYLPYNKHPIATALAELIGRPDGVIPADKIEIIERMGFVVEEPAGDVIPHQPRTVSEMA